MHTTTRFRSASLAARLIALVLVPIIALSVLALQRIETERDAAGQAAAVVEVVDLQRAVSAVYPPAELERIALEGLARIDEIGVPRSLVVAFSGVDLESTYSANLVDIEVALDNLMDRYRMLPLPGGELLGDRLGPIRGALQSQRDLNEAHRATPDDASAVFEDLFALLEDALAATPPGVDPSIDLAGDSARLDALAAVLISAGDYGQVVLQGIVYRTDELSALAATTLARHEAHLDTFESTLTGQELDAFTALRTKLTKAAAPLPAVPPGDEGSTAVDPVLIQQSASIALDQLDYIDQLQEFSQNYYAEVSADVGAAAADAGTRVERTQWLLLTIAILTIALIGLVLWSILSPIRRLTLRAAAIGNGELDLDPLPRRGPHDVRALTETMNVMLTTLHRVNHEVTRLAAGEVDGDTTFDLPGAIGISMRDSVRHLATVTSQLHRSEQLSSAIVAQAADAIWIVDGSGRIRSANRASGELAQVAPDAQLDRPISDFLSQVSGEANVLTGPGPSPKVLVANSVVDVGDERVTVVIAHDISERSQFEERLSYQAHHDALTGLPNRFAVLEHLEQLSSEHGDVAVLFVDLDAFKSINDTQGHAVGDRVLAGIAATLSRSVRNGEFVGRLGGDEFVVISRSFSQPADVMALGHRIIHEIEQPHQEDDQIFVISASVGVAIPPPGTSALDTIRQADNAVYQAKRRGRGRVELFDEGMQELIEREADLELALRHAVRNDELVIHLQPVVDLRSGEINGAEALVRWNRPGHGMVPPNDFIPVAERSSLIFEIERWVLTQACQRISAWRVAQPDCKHRIAVNISGRHLIEGDLLADVEAAIGLTGADPTMLELELTETQLLEDLDRATAVLDELRLRGITIAVDDFGTGYSSMTYLRHLPIDSVKIDRSFVANATEHGYDSTVIEALLTIGRTLELDVVAEGVETDAQLDYVRARGCDRAQGYLLARPMPVDEAEAMMFERTAVPVGQA